MALLPLYRVKSYIRAPKWAKFPEDFYIAGHSIIDDDLINHPDIASYRWSLCISKKNGVKDRARRVGIVNGKRATIHLHREIWRIVKDEVPHGLTIDHKNREPLDNRIENLRLATQGQQVANVGLKQNSSTGYKGVQFYRPAAGRPRPWMAYISPSCYPMCTFGYHLSPHHAAFAYNVGASLYYGEFAVLNEIADGLVPLEDQKIIQESVKNKLIARKLIPDPKSLQMSPHA